MARVKIPGIVFVVAFCASVLSPTLERVGVAMAISFQMQPPSTMPEAEIKAAIDAFNSKNLQEQLSGLNRLAKHLQYVMKPQLYSLIYEFDHQPTKDAMAAVAKPCSLSLALAAMKESNPVVREWALNKLRCQDYRMASQPDSDGNLKLPAIAGPVSKRDVDRVIAAINSAMDDPDPEVRGWALYEAVEYRPGEACDLARAGMKDRSSIVRLKAWLSLQMHVGEMTPDDSLTEHLKAALHDQDDSVVGIALWYVAASGDYIKDISRTEQYRRTLRQMLDACWPLVLKAYDRPGEGFRSSVIRACQAYPQSESLVIKALGDFSLRRQAVSTLGEIGREAALKALTPLLEQVTATAPDKDTTHLSPADVKSAIDQIQDRLRLPLR